MRVFRAFTLIELLVVIAIIGVLLAILTPALSSAREAAKNVQCLSNQRGVGQNTHAYGQDNATFPFSSAKANTFPGQTHDTAWLDLVYPLTGSGMASAIKTLYCPCAGNASPTSADIEKWVIDNDGYWNVYGGQVAGAGGQWTNVSYGYNALGLGGTWWNFGGQGIKLTHGKITDYGAANGGPANDAIGVWGGPGVGLGYLALNAQFATMARMADTILVADSNINVQDTDYWGTLSGSKGWFEFKGFYNPPCSGEIVPRHHGWCNICYCDGHAAGVAAPHANGALGGWKDFFSDGEKGTFGCCPWYKQIPTYPYAFARMAP
jgi:prepilin-type N-terminal cleavage/methylation domain-containing protein/prepilin-type processing-associated H-X9-DG protein